MNLYSNTGSKHKKYTILEGHSVERMYLRQRCFDGSVQRVATVEATEAAASVKILTGAIIVSVIKITIVTFNANSTI